MESENQTLTQEHPPIPSNFPIIENKLKIEDLPGDDNTKRHLKLLFTKLTIIFAAKYIKEDNMPIEVIDNLYIGSIGAALSKDNLKNTGIRAILNCANLKTAFPEDFEYKSMNIKDSMNQDVLGFFKESNDFIGKFLGNKEKVLVHW